MTLIKPSLAPAPGTAPATDTSSPATPQNTAAPVLSQPDQPPAGFKSFTAARAPGAMSGAFAASAAKGAGAPKGLSAAELTRIAGQFSLGNIIKEGPDHGFIKFDNGRVNMKTGEVVSNANSPDHLFGDAYVHVPPAVVAMAARGCGSCVLSADNPQSHGGSLYYRFENDTTIAYDIATNKAEIEAPH